MDYLQSPSVYHNNFSADAQRDGHNDHMKRCNDRNFYGSSPSKRQIEKDANFYHNSHIGPLTRVGGDYLQNNIFSPSCLVTSLNVDGVRLIMRVFPSLPQFNGSKEESPYDHMDKFVEVVRSMLGGVSE